MCGAWAKSEFGSNRSVTCCSSPIISRRSSSRAVPATESTSTTHKGRCAGLCSDERRGLVRIGCRQSALVNGATPDPAGRVWISTMAFQGRADGGVSASVHFLLGRPRQREALGPDDIDCALSMLEAKAVFGARFQLEHGLHCDCAVVVGTQLSCGRPRTPSRRAPLLAARTRISGAVMKAAKRDGADLLLSPRSTIFVATVRCQNQDGN